MTNADALSNFITGANDATNNDVDPDGAIFTGYMEGVDYARSAEFIPGDDDAAHDAFATYFPEAV